MLPVFKLVPSAEELDVSSTKIGAVSRSISAKL